MKKALLLTVVVSAFSFTSCKKNNPTPTTTSTTTTNTTTTTSKKSGTFSASVGGTSINFTGSTSNESGWLLITGTSSGYTIQIVDLSPAVGSITLSDYSSFNSYGSITNTSTGEVWQTDANHTGTLNLTSFNATTFVVTGTVSFTANEYSPTSGASTISVTSGSFSNI